MFWQVQQFMLACNQEYTNWSTCIDYTGCCLSQCKFNQMVWFPYEKALQNMMLLVRHISAYELENVPYIFFNDTVLTSAYCKIVIYCLCMKRQHSMIFTMFT